MKRTQSLGFCRQRVVLKPFSPPLLSAMWILQLRRLRARGRSSTQTTTLSFSSSRLCRFQTVLTNPPAAQCCWLISCLCSVVNCFRNVFSWYFVITHNNRDSFMDGLDCYPLAEWCCWSISCPSSVVNFLRNLFWYFVITHNIRDSFMKVFVTSKQEMLYTDMS